MPDRRSCGHEAQAVEVGGQAQHPISGLRHREETTQGLLVDVVALPAQSLQIEALVPGVEFGALDAEVFGLERGQRGDLPARRRRDLGVHPGQEIVHRGRRFHHTPPHDVMRVIRQAVEAGQLLAQHGQFAQPFDIGVAAAVDKGPIVALARRPALGMGHERVVFRIIETHFDAAVFAPRDPRQVAFREPAQRRFRENHHLVVVAQVALETLSQRLDAFQQLLGAGPLFGRQGRAGVLEGFQQVAAQFRIHRIPRGDGGDALVQLGILEQAGLETVVGEDAFLAGGAYIRVGMHVGLQVDRADSIFKTHVQVVPGRQDVIDGDGVQRQSSNRVGVPAGPLDGGVAGRGDPVGAVVYR
jgi:hypothetical protein